MLPTDCMPSFIPCSLPEALSFRLLGENTRLCMSLCTSVATRHLAAPFALDGVALLLRGLVVGGVEALAEGLALRGLWGLRHGLVLLKGLEYDRVLTSRRHGARGEKEGLAACTRCT